MPRRIAPSLAAAAVLLRLVAGTPAALDASAFVPAPAGAPAIAGRGAAATTTTRCGMTPESLLEAPSVPAPVGSRVLRLPARGTRVRLFYPTTPEAAAAAAAAEEGKEGRGGMTYAPYGTDGRSMGLASRLAGASSGCVLDAPLAVTAGINGGSMVGNGTKAEVPLPLLVYSHGVGGNMDAATRLFGEVASRGTIVATVEHTDGTASSTVRPDGSELEYSSYFMTERQQLARRAQEILEAADILSAELGGIDKVAGDNSSPGSGAGAVGPIVLGGHGWGAPSAVMAANGAPSESNICGIILHDPKLGMGYGMLPPNKADNRLPAITYISDKYNKARVRYGARTLHVKGCRHENFVDAPLWAPRLGPLSVDPVQVHEQLSESMATFLWNRDAKSSAISRGNLFEVVR